MRMLHKSNSKSTLIFWCSVTLFGVLSACSSMQQPTAKASTAQRATQNVVSSEENSGASNELNRPDNVTTENFNTKTVVPVGFEKFMGIFTPYRLTIQQGNFVSKEMADQVKEGMAREQVRLILGTALLTDMFHADRWDYIFRLLKPNGELTTSRMTVHFHQSLVSKIERGDLPNEKEYLAIITDGGLGDSNSESNN